ncbi:hypothetical protein ACJX0J_014911 [Zea mays]
MRKDLPAKTNFSTSFEVNLGINDYNKKTSSHLSSLFLLTHTRRFTTSNCLYMLFFIVSDTKRLNCTIINFLHLYRWKPPGNSHSDIIRSLESIFKPRKVYLRGSENSRKHLKGLLFGHEEYE